MKKMSATLAAAVGVAGGLLVTSASPVTAQMDLLGGLLNGLLLPGLG